MSEDEAKTKWCPMVGRFTRNGADRETCIGSACMMWRNIYSGATEFEFYLDGSPDVEIKRETVGGYCGLAGKP